MENDYLCLFLSSVIDVFFSLPSSLPSPPFLSFYVHGSSVWSSHLAPEIGATHSKGVFLRILDW